MADDLKPIYERIHKLLTLAERAGTPGEAAAAAARVQALLFRYNLDRAEVEAKRPTGEDAYERVDWDVPGARSGSLNWRRRLVIDVASLNFCHPIIWTGRGRMTLVGRAHNIRVAQWTAEYLLREIEALALRDWRALDEWEQKATHWLRWRVAFCQGAVDTVAARLAEQRRMEQAAAGETGRALVVMERQHARAAAQRLVAGLRPGRDYGGDTDAEARYRGRLAGREIALNRPIENVAYGGSLAAAR